MAMLTKLDIIRMAQRLRGLAYLMARQSERADLESAAAALEVLADLVSVDWPIAVGE